MVYPGPAPSSIVATIGAATGVYCGSGQGVASITASNGCFPSATAIITVNAFPAPIAGTHTLCSGLTSVYSNTSTGGTWTSSDTTIATIDSLSGMLTAVDTGIVTITYNNGCGTPLYFSITILKSFSCRRLATLKGAN